MADEDDGSGVSEKGRVRKVPRTGLIQPYVPLELAPDRLTGIEVAEEIIDIGSEFSLGPVNKSQHLGGDGGVDSVYGVIELERNLETDRGTER